VWRRVLKVVAQAALAQCLSALAASMGAVPKQRVDLGVGNVILRAGVLGAGQALGVTALGCARAAFDRGAWRQRWWRVRKSGCRVLPARRAVVGSTGLEQLLEVGGDKGSTPSEMLATAPGPEKPDQRHHEQEDEPTGMGQHR